MDCGEENVKVSRRGHKVKKKRALSFLCIKLCVLGALTLRPLRETFFTHQPHPPETKPEPASAQPLLKF